MIEQFFDTNSIVYGIFKILLIVGIGYILYVFKVLNSHILEWLNKLLLWICLPVLIFAKIASGFDANVIESWWHLPLYAFAITFLGFILGYVFQKFFLRFNSSEEFTGCCAFQNAGYIPLTLTTFVCSGDFCNIIFIYIFLYLIGFNILFWGFAPAYFSKDIRKNFKFSKIFNAPFIATVVSLLVVFSGLKETIPQQIYIPLNFIGSATFYIALIILGGFLAKNSGFKPDRWDVIGACVFVKLILMPFIVFLVLRVIDISFSLKFFIFLEAIMPTAVSLVIVGNYVKADNKLLSGVILYSHALAAITMPLWLILFQKTF